MNFAFIINPRSAKGEYEPFLEAINTRFINPNYIISQSIEDTNNFIAQNWENTDIFVAVGGDGTISSVAKKLINTDKILAIYPAGSGNGFANEVNFTKNIDDLIRKLKHFNYQEIDTFWVNDILSINVSGVGFDGEITKEFEKTSRGLTNYMKVIVNIFPEFTPIKINFHTESLQQYNGEYLMMSIANSKQYGNDAYIAPNADMSDGMLEFALVKKFPLTYAMPFAFKMFNKTLKSDEYIQYFSASEIDFSADTDTWHIDGEYTSIKSPVNIKVLPKSLKVLI